MTAGSGPQPQLSFNAFTNQNSGDSYDAAGNVIHDGSHSYTYDAEGNIVKVDGGSTATYTYGALNRRVNTVVDGASTDFVFNAQGQRVSEWNAATHAQIQGQYYWGARPVAFYKGGQTYFQHQDWEGTERMRTTYNGSVAGSFTSLAFGDAQTTVSGSDLDQYHYAMLDTDSESDTDHAQFRQYSSTEGRWMSPDPYAGSYDISNPQSMNRYAYVLNNPLSNIDPPGLDCLTINEDGSVTDIPGDCPGVDPNNEYYYDCGGVGLPDGCTQNPTYDPNTSTISFTLPGSTGYTNGTILGADYTAPGDPPSNDDSSSTIFSIFNFGAGGPAIGGGGGSGPTNQKQLPNRTITTPEPQMSKFCASLNAAHQNDTMTAEHDLQRSGAAFVGGLEPVS